VDGNPLEDLVLREIRCGRREYRHFDVFAPKSDR
jgi:hypothetical protein